MHNNIQRRRSGSKFVQPVFLSNGYHLLYVSAPVQDTDNNRLQAGDIAQEELSLELCLLQH